VWQGRSAGAGGLCTPLTMSMMMLGLHPHSHPGASLADAFDLLTRTALLGQSTLGHGNLGPSGTFTGAFMLLHAVPAHQDSW